jgi:hypothetical protein
VKINISSIENRNGISNVQTADANKIIGGDGVTINFDIALQDGGPGAANAGIPKFNFVAQTVDIDASNSSNGRPNHSAALILSGQLGD